MAGLKLIAGASLIASALGGVSVTHLGQEHIEAMPMHRYSNTCGSKSRLHIKARAGLIQQDKNVPGAGIDPCKDGCDTVLKDGFMETACIKDYMYYRGDKFGDNKYDYKLGPVSNVSIVHYEDYVAKEDRQEMTQAVCFEFCRTVPNMGFFGIVNGRGCYCAPYFQAMASSSEECDSVCEGDTTLMCGGKSKSSVFTMHMCASTKEDLGERVATATSMEATLKGAASMGEEVGNALQHAGEGLQSAFGNVGDSGASNIGQTCKVHAGTLIHKSEDALAVAEKLGELVKSTSTLSDFTNPEQVTQAERTMEGIDQTVAEGEVVGDELEALLKAADPKSVTGAAKQYYPAMYFVDKKYDSVPSTCTGDMVGKPMEGSADACAAACDNHIHDCVGFQFFDFGEQGSGCVMLANFKTGFYYTGCGGSEEKEKKMPPLDFLQTDKKTKEAPFQATCYAKLSKFEGTTLAVDGSGKCKQCFKDLTKADRCY